MGPLIVKTKDSMPSGRSLMCLLETESSSCFLRFGESLCDEFYCHSITILYDFFSWWLLYVSEIVSFFLVCFLTAVEIVSKIVVVAIDLERDYLFKKVQYKLKLFKNNGKR